jgi:hypothetical protein
MTSSLQNTESAGFWTPPPSLVNHKGDALDNKVIFFAPPPPEIGQLLSGYSSLGLDLATQKRDGYATYSNWLQAFIWTFLAGFLSWFILVLATKAETLSLIIGVVVGAFTLWRTLQKDAGVDLATCTYVGTQGVAQYVWQDDESKRLTPVTLRFKDVAELRTWETRQFINGAYQHTTYGFMWTGGSSPDGYGIGGLYRHQQGTPPAHDRYYFALAAEHAWTVFSLERALQQLAQGSSVTFDIKNGDTFTLSSAALELRRKGETIQLSRDDEPRLHVQNGVLTLSSKDTTRSFFGTKGAYSFKYLDVANARLLLVLFDNLMKR